MKGLEIDGLIVRRALLPAPIQDADPYERQRSYGSLMGLAFFALLLVGDLRPEGMPDRLRRPCDERVPEALGTLEAPVHPSLLAAAFGHRRDPGIFLQFCNGSIPCALFAKGDRRRGAKTGPAPGSAWKKGKSGWRWAHCAMAVSKSAMACKVTRSWATRLHQQRSGADALQRPLRSRFRARLTAGVLLLGV